MLHLGGVIHRFATVGAELKIRGSEMKQRYPVSIERPDNPAAAIKTATSKYDVEK